MSLLHGFLFFLVGLNRPWAGCWYDYNPSQVGGQWCDYVTSTFFLPTWCPGLWTGLPPHMPETGLTAEHDTNYIVTRQDPQGLTVTAAVRPALSEPTRPAL